MDFQSIDKLFDASQFAVERLDDLNALVVVIAERGDGGGQRLELQRALQASPEDQRLGMDTYCICTADGASYYGGIIKWEVQPNGIIFALQPDAALALGLPVRFKIGIALKRDDVPRLKEGLRHVIGWAEQVGLPS